jgi:dihydroxy-acid dehydratase
VEVLRGREGRADDQEEFLEAEAGMSRSAGSCNTMGTASTMASMAEALGMAPVGQRRDPGGGRAAPHHRAAVGAADRADGQGRPQALGHPDQEAFENAIRTNAAIGGLTNAVIHLLAIAGRVGIDLSLEDWDRCGRDVPTIVNTMPSGKYLMEEFFYAGGLPAVISGWARRGSCTATR